MRREEELEDALREARRLNNQTVRNASEVEAWHKYADRLLSATDTEAERRERWDAPHRVEHREFCRRVYNW